MTGTLVLPEVIGHRGAPRRAPENSLAGFAEAARLGVTWVELDVQLSRDLLPVVFHDELLDRTSNGSGRLIEQTGDSLLALDVGSWFSPAFAGQRLPSFAQVIDCLISLRLGVNIEIKAEDARAALTAEKGLQPALARWPADLPAPLVTSFSRQALAIAQELAPDWPRGLVSHQWVEDWQAVAERYGCATFHVSAGEITPERVAAARHVGLQVLAYVVDDPAQAHQLWEWGVSALFSDRPEALLGGSSLTRA